MKEKIKLVIGMIIAIMLVMLIGMLAYQGVCSVTDKSVNPLATFEIQDYGNIKIELYPEYAPNTVTNMIALIEAGYYNNKVIYGKDDICLYMARNADESKEGPSIHWLNSEIEEDSDDDYAYEIDGEFIANGFEQNTLRHEKGVLSLNRSDYSSYGLTEESYNSGSAQFSILMEDSPNLNGVYCAFGKVIEGFDILEKIYQEVQIAESEEENADSIQEFSAKPVITNVTIERNNVDFGKPKTHKAFDIQEYINNLYSQYYSN